MSGKQSSYAVSEIHPQYKPISIISKIYARKYRSSWLTYKNQSKKQHHTQQCRIRLSRSQACNPLSYMYLKFFQLAIFWKLKTGEFHCCSCYTLQKGIRIESRWVVCFNMFFITIHIFLTAAQWFNHLLELLWLSFVMQDILLLAICILY